MEQQEMSPIRGLILTALGEASMAWSETPKGVFNDQEVTRLADTLERAINEEQKSLLTRFYNRRSDASPLEASVQEAQENEWSAWIEAGVPTFEKLD